MSTVAINGHAVEFVAEITGNAVLIRSTTDGIDKKGIPHVEGRCAKCARKVVVVPEHERERLLHLGYLSLAYELADGQRDSDGEVILVCSAPAELMATWVPVEDSPG